MSKPYLRRQALTAAVATAVSVSVDGAAAQQPERQRRVGVLMNLAADDQNGQVRLAAFIDGLRGAGWIEGRNLRLDVRWGAGDAGQFHGFASELVGLTPDVLLAASGATMPALLQATRTVPIVFVLVPDPLGSKFVASLAQPGGNATGFMQHEFGLGAKWVELMREIAPDVARLGVLHDPDDPAGAGQLAAIRTAAVSVGKEVDTIDVRIAAGIEREITAFARAAKGGLIVTGSSPAGMHRRLIIALAAQHRLPAIYPYRHYATDGGLIAYGPDTVDPYRRAAGYVDRILKGERPADLPVQAPTAYELAINLRTARDMGLSVPASLLARAGEVIE